MTQPFASLLEIDSISESSRIFEKLGLSHYYYSYFQVNQTYYLFFYAAQKNNSLLEEVYQSITVIQELNTKTRRIRSLRGFLLYTLEIRKHAQRVEILQTNLPSLFWTRVERILRQSHTGTLEDFLFGASKSIVSLSDPPQESQLLEERVQRIESQITFFTQELKELKERLALKNPPETFNPVESESKKAASHGSKTTFTKTPTRSARSSSQSETSFKKLKEIPKEEQISIIEEGFELSQRFELSLRDYYEGTTHPQSLFQSEGYRLNYESVRRSQVYQRLKKLNF
jgi:hypothetical protein